jgi:hypothetical protein
MADEADDYVIPIYLDTTALLDILASIEDGFFMSATVTTYSSDSKNTQLSGKAEFGVGFLNLFSMALHGSGTREKGSQASKENVTERKYTYGSLLYRLRKNLLQQKLLTEIRNQGDWEGVIVNLMSLRSKD